MDKVELSTAQLLSQINAEIEAAKAAPQQALAKPATSSTDEPAAGELSTGSVVVAEQTGIQQKDKPEQKPEPLVRSVKKVPVKKADVSAKSSRKKKLRNKTLVVGFY